MKQFTDFLMVDEAKTKGTAIPSKKRGKLSHGS